MYYFLQIQDIPPFYKDPTILEAAGILFRIFALVAFLWFVKILRSIPKHGSALDPESGIHVVSPFLITEQQQGDLYFSRKKNTIGYRIIAVVLILVFTIVPLVAILEDSGLLYSFYY